jgi:hypothetical protein
MMTLSRECSSVKLTVDSGAAGSQPRRRISGDVFYVLRRPAVGSRAVTEIACPVGHAKRQVFRIASKRAASGHRSGADNQSVA